MSIVAIVNYGVSNIGNVCRAVRQAGAIPRIIDHREDLGDATHIILPGVGTFPEAMRNLRERGLVQALGETASSGRHMILGICLGMQLLAEASDEAGGDVGLGLISGHVRRLVPAKSGERVPHVGWNEVHFEKDTPLFENLASAQDFYFSNSYHFVPASDAHELATTPYCGRFVSVVGRGNVLGVQFHPELSSTAGRTILKNFLAL